jgi:hypothetical protein
VRHDNASKLAKPEDAQDEHHNHDEPDDVDDIVHDWSPSLHRPKTIVRVRTIWRNNWWQAPMFRVATKFLSIVRSLRSRALPAR